MKRKPIARKGEEERWRLGEEYSIPSLLKRK
jgi:hypothetical protein